MTRYLFVLWFALMTLISACHKSDIPPDSSFNTLLRISTENDAQTLDPRKVRDLSTTTVIYMLYEGLTRLDNTGKPTPALAEAITVSPDQKTYTFKLRPSTWSNGQPVTAKDFEQTWKSQLDPSFAAPNAYQLYVIKGAKEAKAGQIPLNQVGIRAPDDQTLIVELVNPTPYFLNLTSTYFYYPVESNLRDPKAKSEDGNITAFVSNGPFKLDKWLRHNELDAVRNPSYWDAKAVHLDRIEIVVLDNATALNMFNKNGLDWTGSPLSTIPVDAIQTLKKLGNLNMTPSAGTFWIRFNVDKPPFNDAKMRQAFNLALNRTDLVEHVLQGNQIPAYGIIPPSFMDNQPYFEDNDLAKAQRLFNEVLTEHHMTYRDLPLISLCYSAGERNHKIAQVLQQHWKDAFGIHVQLMNCEGKVFFDKLKSHDFQMGLGSWFADIRDPISFLDVFKFKDNGTNNTQWEDSHYIGILNASSFETNPTQRAKMLGEAEGILMENMPIAPLFYNTYNHLNHPHVKGVYFSELGYLDFKKAYFE